MNINGSTHSQKEKMLSLLQQLLQEMSEDQDLAPWQAAPPHLTSAGGRVSATDRLTWWFRPITGGDNAWERYFAQSFVTPFSAPSAPPPVSDFFTGAPPPNLAPPPSDRNNLRMILLEPEDELIDSDAEATVACLYSFVHAIGRRDVEAAMTCIAPDFHTFSDDQEFDRQGLFHYLKALIDSLRDGAFEISLVEIPRPVLHPDAILIYAEIQIDTVKHLTNERPIITERRLVVFQRQKDGSWLIIGLCPV
jgi:ketosteroid isomerase-like protein